MSNNTVFRYILRYTIDPTFHPEDRMKELLAYCQESHTEEVMLFLPGEELSPGHVTKEDLRPYCELGKRLKAKLGQANIALSLNPWTTLYQITRGRRFRPGQNFTPMVGETGFVNAVTACPLCPAWQDYLVDIHLFLAEQLEPIAIWIEDDWRLHNHDAPSGWGGCFCDLHMARFSQRVGRQVTRETSLRKILTQGPPHPWRDIWLDISRESLLEPAKKLGENIHAVHPATRIGLMSSAPDTHCAEGRDWPALQEAFGARPAFLTRPHLPPYTEGVAIQTPPVITRHTLANLKRPIDVYPELESGPRTGPYSKSTRYAVWQCFNAAVYGSDGITINHFDMIGNGTLLHKTFAGGLAKAKPQLNALASLGIDDQNSHGINVIFSPRISRHIHTRNSNSMANLSQDSTAWSTIFFALGIAHRISKDISSPTGGCALSGQTLRALSDQEISDALAGTVFLDACSAEILLEKGHGRLIGLESGQWLTLDDAAFSYESIEEPNSDVFGLAHPRMTAQLCTDRMFAMTPCSGASIRSTIRTADHQALCPGTICYTNELGGRVVILAYPFVDRAEFDMSFFNTFRCQFLQNLIFETVQGAKQVVALDHPMHVYCNQTQNGLLIAAFNTILDDAETVKLRVSKGLLTNEPILTLDNQGHWTSVHIERSANAASETIEIPTRLRPLSGLFLLQKKQN